MLWCELHDCVLHRRNETSSGKYQIDVNESRLFYYWNRQTGKKVASFEQQSRETCWQRDSLLLIMSVFVRKWNDRAYLNEWNRERHTLWSLNINASTNDHERIPRIVLAQAKEMSLRKKCYQVEMLEQWKVQRPAELCSSCAFK